LVHSFGLSVSLWMLSSGGREFNTEYSVKFTSEFGNKLGSPIRHNFTRKSVMFPNVLDEKTSRPRNNDGGDCRGEVGSFCDRIYYHHNRIMTGRFWEFNYEVYTYGVPRSVRNRERV
jgi:hypothetical protein